MHAIAKGSLIGLAFSVLAGCGGPEPATQADQETAQEPVETVLDDQLKAMDRARAVEDDVLQHQDDQLRKIDEATGG